MNKKHLNRTTGIITVALLLLISLLIQIIGLNEITTVVIAVTFIPTAIFYLTLTLGKSSPIFIILLAISVTGLIVTMVTPFLHQSYSNRDYSTILTLYSAMLTGLCLVTAWD